MYKDLFLASFTLKDLFLASFTQFSLELNKHDNNDISYVNLQSKIYFRMTGFLKNSLKTRERT